MKTKGVCQLLAMVAPLAVWADGVTVVTDPIVVDLRAENALIRISDDATDIGYSAAWVTDAATAETKCVLTKTAHAGTEGQVVTTLADTTAEGSAELKPDADGSRNFVLTLKAMNGATELASVRREIAFGVAGSDPQGVRADTTDAKLQNAVDDGIMSFDLACDTSWVPDAASATITQEKVRWTSKTGRAPAETTTVLSESAPYDGSYTHVIPPNQGQDCEFTLVFRDANGDPIGEPLIACYSKGCKFGMLLLLR